MSEIRTFEQCMVIQPNVWNPNRIVRISDTFTTEQKLEPNRREVSEIQTCSDFGRLLYCSFVLWSKLPLFRHFVLFLRNRCPRFNLTQNKCQKTWSLFTKPCRRSSLRYLTYGLLKWALNLRFTTNFQANHNFGHLSYEKPVHPCSFRSFDLSCCQTYNFKSFNFNE